MNSQNNSGLDERARTSLDKGARLSYGNFLKIVCAVIIVIYHYRHLAFYSDLWEYRSWLPLDEYFEIIYTYGYTVVELFFILSGFGLFSQYILRSRDARAGVGFAGFMKPKLYRLYPVFAITALLCIILQTVAIAVDGNAVLGMKNENLFAYIQTFLLVKGGLFSSSAPYNVPTWFLTPLIVCYLLFWLVFYGARKLPDGWRLAISILFIVAGAVIVYNKLDVSILNARIGRGLASFFAGVVLGWVCNNVALSKPVVAVLSTVFLAGSIPMIVTGFGGSLYLPSIFVWSALMLLLECVPRGFFMRFEKPNAKAASISYALFCTHYVVLTAIAVLDLFYPLAQDYGRWWFFALYAVITLVFSIAMTKIGGKAASLGKKRA